MELSLLHNCTPQVLSLMVRILSIEIMVTAKKTSILSLFFLCLMFETCCTAQQRGRKHLSFKLLYGPFGLFNLFWSMFSTAIIVVFLEFMPHFISSPHFSFNSLIRLHLISHGLDLAAIC